MAVRRLALVAAIGFAAYPPSAKADILAELATICLAAVESGDRSGFEQVAGEILKRRDVFNAESRKRAEECLSRGYGEPWEYWFPGQRWEPSAEVEARLKATEATKEAQAKAEADAAAAAAQAEADRQANAARIAAVVYASCIDLAEEDLRAAMTNSVCVESFLTNGLPADLGP